MERQGSVVLRCAQNDNEGDALRRSEQTDGNPIKRLVFVSRVSHENPNLRYNRLECATDTLRRFLKSWVNELKKLSLDPEEIVESPRFAAPKWHENEAA
jgi:hypothetical protein